MVTVTWGLLSVKLGAEEAGLSLSFEMELREGDSVSSENWHIPEGDFLEAP